ncbi:hypothetical protein CVT25_002087 [Psilocybe cyanescens]|uniref:Uncharacterized protein n=1 Tax=Psilocybe cyanescens TaxID=93625 RepID=A0A409X9E4_PSICY|nr:hypothetical protein CVT25_002087 [Psilocybe cyanescens]
MTFKSDPTINPTKPDPVTRNQPDSDNTSTEGVSGEQNIPGSYPSSPKDTTSSGGYSATPENTWSDKSQRGTNFPLGTESNSANVTGESSNDTGLIDQSTSGTDLVPEIQDAKQGRDKAFDNSEDVWGVEKGAGKDF